MFRRITVASLALGIAVSLGCGQSGSDNPGRTVQAAASIPDTAEHPARLIGKWTCTRSYGNDYFKIVEKTNVEFKPKGGLNWSHACNGFGGETETAVWKCVRKEGDRYTLQQKPDLYPDNLWGWVVEFVDDDTIRLQVPGDSYVLKRVK